MDLKIEPLVENLNTFAFDLYTSLSASAGNLCISPLSLSMALAMTFAGARGTTERQMAKVMQIPTAQAEFHRGFSRLLDQIYASGQSHGIELLLANSIYPYDSYPFRKDFLDCLRENYRVVLTPVNYADPENARGIINQWVKKSTRDYIPELVSPGIIDRLTRLVLVNAVYFKGLWQSPFDKQETLPRPFWRSEDSAITIPTMQQKESFNYAEDDRVQVLELPYQGNQLSLVIILPKGGLFTVEKSLTYSHYSKWLAGFSEEMVDIHLPIFKIKGEVVLNDILVSMGMTDAFDQDHADFSGMDGKKYPEGLYIRDVIQQANLEIAEEGTTAAAATGVFMAMRGIPREFQFHVDRPFLFLLRENTTGSILFLGRVLNPVN